MVAQSYEQNGDGQEGIRYMQSQQQIDINQFQKSEEEQIQQDNNNAIEYNAEDEFRQCGQ